MNWNQNSQIARGSSYSKKMSKIEKLSILVGGYIGFVIGSVIGSTAGKVMGNEAYSTYKLFNNGRKLDSEPDDLKDEQINILFHP